MFRLLITIVCLFSRFSGEWYGLEATTVFESLGLVVNVDTVIDHNGIGLALDVELTELKRAIWIDTFTSPSGLEITGFTIHTIGE